MTIFGSRQVAGTVSSYSEPERLTGRSGYNTLIALFAGTVLGSIGTFLLEAAYIAASR